MAGIQDSRPRGFLDFIARRPPDLSAYFRRLHSQFRESLSTGALCLSVVTPLLPPAPSPDYIRTYIWPPAPSPDYIRTYIWPPAPSPDYIRTIFGPRLRGRPYIRTYILAPLWPHYGPILAPHSERLALTSEKYRPPPIPPRPPSLKSISSLQILHLHPSTMSMPYGAPVASKTNNRFRQAALIVSALPFDRELPIIIEEFRKKPYNITKFSFISLEPNTYHVFLHAKDGITLGQWERLKLFTRASRIHFVEQPVRSSKIEDEFSRHPNFCWDTLKWNEIILKVSLMIFYSIFLLLYFSILIYSLTGMMTG